MQILRWLFKVAHEEKAREISTSLDNKEVTAAAQEANPKHIVLSEHQKPKKVEENELGHHSSKVFAVLRRRDIAKAYFYSILNLKRLKNFNRRQHWNRSMRMKKEDIARGLGISHKADSAAHAGNRVLPISDTTPSSSDITNDQCGSLEKKDRLKGDKTKVISRMKELLRWAAAAKSEKGGKYISRKVLYFRNRGTLKAVPDDDQLSNDSPKISFRWDLESCSTSSSAYSAFSMASSSKNVQAANNPSMNSTPIQDPDGCPSRTGNWITTDSEFVVLEL
ncbi:hypothetical protein L1049_003889 [Liquidambar formosana]|uniref:Uncharacterized protein n=1 Tax=Liquidambar formosana TaxID=63359 RepID=A0AAP0RN54_LIQFO